MTTDMSLHIQKCMTKKEREGFLNTFCMNNPHYRGAEVADILSVLFDSDSHIDHTDAMYEAHKAEIDPYPPGLYNMCVFVGIYLCLGTEWNTIHTLMQRFNPKTA